MISIVLLFSFCHLLTSEQVEVWCYYDTPPFSDENNEGLAADFVALMNSFTDDDFSFHLHIIPRARLNKMLEKKLTGIVLFSAPRWMNDPDRHLYHWSAPILKDWNVLITRKGSRIRVDSPHSFTGSIFGGIHGRNYSHIEKIAPEGSSSIQYTKNELENLHKLHFGRIDYTTQPMTIARYSIQLLHYENSLQIDPSPLAEFYRYLMLSGENRQLLVWMRQLPKRIGNSQEWQEILKKYYLTPAY